MKNKKLMIGATLLLTLSAASAFSVDTRPALKRRDRVMSIEAGGHKFVGSVMERFRDRKSGQYMVRIDLGWDAGEVTRPEKSLIRAVRSIGDIKKGHGVIEADRANHYLFPKVDELFENGDVLVKYDLFDRPHLRRVSQLSGRTQCNARIGEGDRVMKSNGGETGGDFGTVRAVWSNGVAEVQFDWKIGTKYVYTSNLNPWGNTKCDASQELVLSSNGSRQSSGSMIKPSVNSGGSFRSGPSNQGTSGSGG